MLRRFQHYFLITSIVVSSFVDDRLPLVKSAQVEAGCHFYRRLSLRGGSFSWTDASRAHYYNSKGEEEPPPPEAINPRHGTVSSSDSEIVEDAPECKDLNSDDESGYDVNPFEGVQCPGFFQAENVDVQSEDEIIRKLNKQLWVACRNGDADEAARLIQQGAEVNAGDPETTFDWTALMHCCTPKPAAALPDLECAETAEETETRRLALLDCLLEHGARIDVTDIYGETPLHYAAVRGYPRLARRLIELGVDIHRENMYGNKAQRIAEMNQRHNPGCMEAADIIADAGGYDCGWPDIHERDDDPRPAGGRGGGRRAAARQKTGSETPRSASAGRRGRRRSVSAGRARK